MRYKVIVSDSAYKDLESIKAYIAIDNEVAAIKYIGKVFDRLESLSDMPFRGPSIHNSLFDYAKAHYIICANHVAIYQINDLAKCVYVLRVLSHFQNWKSIVNKDILNQPKSISESERLHIAKMDHSMCYDVYRNSLDEDNRKYVPDEVFGSLEEASEAVEQIVRSYESEEGPFVYAIIRKEDKANIGYVQLAKTSEGWEVGYHVAKLFTGRGYASEALDLFLRHLQDNTDLERVYGIALANNKASRRVLEKCGFEVVFEGSGIYQGKRRKIIKTVKIMK